MGVVIVACTHEKRLRREKNTVKAGNAAEQRSAAGQSTLFIAGKEYEKVQVGDA